MMVGWPHRLGGTVSRADSARTRVNMINPNVKGSPVFQKDFASHPKLLIGSEPPALESGDSHGAYFRGVNLHLGCL